MSVAEMRCDIIIPVYNKPELTGACLRSIQKHTDSAYRIMLIDNGCDDDTKRLLDGYKSSNSNVSVINNAENIGWVKAVNQGIKASSEPYLCIMNNDTVVETAGWLSKLIAVARAEPDIGLVNPEFGDAKCEKAVRTSRPYIEVDFCRGYCVLIKRSVIDKIGGLDEAYGMGYYDDDDYSVRAIRAGFRCVRVCGVTVRHLRDSTFTAIFSEDKRRALHQKNKDLFYARWGKRLRVVFALTGDHDKDSMASILLGLARRQHIVYIWNAKEPVGVEHINVREKQISPFISRVMMPVLMRLNVMKKDTKRFSAVFADDARTQNTLKAVSGNALAVYEFDPRKDRDRVFSLIDAMAKV